MEARVEQCQDRKIQDHDVHSSDRAYTVGEVFTRFVNRLEENLLSDYIALLVVGLNQFHLKPSWMVEEL